MTVEHIDARTLKAMRDLGREIIVVDVRSEAAFEERHLPFALSLPFWRDFDARAQRWLPKHRWIVVYGEPEAQRAAERLLALGFSHVSCLCEGVSGWIRAHMPVELEQERLSA